jgi:hypothetical protein
VALALAVAAPVSAAKARIPRTPEKCGRVVLAVAHRQPGIILTPPRVCGQVQIPGRYEVRQGAGPRVADVYLRDRRMVTVVMPEEAPPTPPTTLRTQATPPIALTVVDKRARHFATRRWRRVGMEFVTVTARMGRALEDEEAIQ